MPTLKTYHLFFFAFLFFAFINNSLAVTSAPIIIDGGPQGCVPETEICGDGIDQDCNGSDLLCDGADKDRDGYSTDDCDDSNRQIFPGVAISCNEVCQGGYKTCLSSGQFSSCNCQPLCEGTKCYYISPTFGSDSNPGTFSAPWKTTRNFRYYWTSSEMPANWVDLQAGTFVYFMSGHYPIETSPMDLSRRKGTATSPIVFKAYPGAIATISPTSVTATLPVYGIQLYQAQYIRIEDLEISRAKTRAIFIEEAKGIEVTNCIIHDTWGTAADNLSAIYVTGSESSRFHHNIIYDNYDRTRAWASGTGVILFSGGNNRVDHNVLYTSNIVASDVQIAGILYKHTATVAGQTFEADHNILVRQKNLSIGTGSSNSRIHHNLIINSDPMASTDFGGATSNQEIYFENNTLINTRAIKYSPTNSWNPIGKFYFRKNLVVESQANSGENSVVVIGEYDSDTLYNLVVGGSLLVFSSNCYYNSGGAQYFRLYAGSPATTGQSYSFSGWQGAGYDSLSTNVNPTINSSYRPSNAACADKGWLAQ